MSSFGVLKLKKIMQIGKKIRNNPASPLLTIQTIFNPLGCRLGCEGVGIKVSMPNNLVPTNNDKQGHWKFLALDLA
jgi:hypothetical protein